MNSYFLQARIYVDKPKWITECSLYTDFLHLSWKGIEKFSKLIIETIKEPNDKHNNTTGITFTAAADTVSTTTDTTAVIDVITTPTDTNITTTTDTVTVTLSLPTLPQQTIGTLSKKRRSRGRGGQQEDFRSNGIEVDSI